MARKLGVRLGGSATLAAGSQDEDRWRAAQEGGHSGVGGVAGDFSKNLLDGFFTASNREPWATREAKNADDGRGSFEGRLGGRAHLSTATGQGTLSHQSGWVSVMAVTAWCDGMGQLIQCYNRAHGESSLQLPREQRAGALPRLRGHHELRRQGIQQHEDGYLDR